MVLTFVIIFVALSAWDVGHVNHVIEKTVNPGQKHIYYK